MNDHDALLRAIIENPAEDTPRLVFADWLDENADVFPNPDGVRARAAFIRTDIALSSRGEYDPDRLRWELIEKPRREAESWTSLLPGVYELLRGPMFQRGFPWGVRLTPSQFLANTDRVLRDPIRALAFRGTDSATDALFRSPHFARLAALNVNSANVSDRSAQVLAGSPHAASLEELDTRDDGFTPPALMALLRSRLFPQLTRLEMGGGAPAAGFIVSSFSTVKARTRLRDLTLANVGLSGAHLPQLLTAPAMEHVERLRLAGNRLGASGHEAVARLPLEHLRKLDLSETAPGAEGFRALSTSLTLSKLERLGYRRNHVTGALLAELAACYEVNNLRVLDLSNNAIGNAGATAIARSPHFARLQVLYLSYCMVGDEGMFALLESPLADNLVLLDLTGSSASAETQELLKARMGDRVRL